MKQALYKFEVISLAEKLKVQLVNIKLNNNKNNVQEIFSCLLLYKYKNLHDCYIQEYSKMQQAIK